MRSRTRQITTGAKRRMFMPCTGVSVIFIRPEIETTKICFPSPLQIPLNWGQVGSSLRVQILKSHGLKQLNLKVFQKTGSQALGILGDETAQASARQARSQLNPKSFSISVFQRAWNQEKSTGLEVPRPGFKALPTPHKLCD